jgi:hypothetical protein
VKSQILRWLIGAAVWLAFSIPAYSDQDWPPKDPDQEVTKTDFTVAWALKLAGFKTLAELQKAAGSKGKITENHADDEKDPRVSYHWGSHPSNGRIGFMMMTVRRNGDIAGGVMTDEGVEVIVNTLGALICEKCSPPIEIQGAPPRW